MGAERMAGSNPEYGMAEPGSWIDHDHADMKELNCVYTRVHWQQDRRLLDWCDRHGMLIQTEVPTWGLDTFKGMVSEPSPGIMNNGLEQLREMIGRDRNHPCIFSWGVCNEIGGQNPPAYAFAKRMYDEAKSLDPQRLVTYASNSLQETPAKDVVGLMDYIMWNEYYESWYDGGPADMSPQPRRDPPRFPGQGDRHLRVRLLRLHRRPARRATASASKCSASTIAIFRERDYVAGLIFFCYNDYRTHIGDRGTGVMRAASARCGRYIRCDARLPGKFCGRSRSPIESLNVIGSPAAGDCR